MAYMSQEKKKELSPGIKKVLKEYGVSGSISVGRGKHSLVVTLKKGDIDFYSNMLENMKEDARRGGTTEIEAYFRQLNAVRNNKAFIDVNTYHIDSQWTGKAKEFLLDLHRAMNVGNHDNSDSQTDYFDVGWYTDIVIGRWPDKPYEFNGDMSFDVEEALRNFESEFGNYILQEQSPEPEGQAFGM